LLIGGLAVAACAVAPLSSQAPVTSKAYVVAEINVTDTDAYREYVRAAFPIIQRYNGKFLTRGGTTVAVEGAPPAERVMIIEFPSLARAKEFEYSRDYTGIAPLRRASAESRLFIVEGSPDPARSQP
jgi:uncharacterized protein (DUF1330 family)